MSNPSRSFALASKPRITGPSPMKKSAAPEIRTSLYKERKKERKKAQIE